MIGKAIFDAFFLTDSELKYSGMECREKTVKSNL